MRVEWVSEREKTIAVVVKRRESRLLIISAYFRHIGHSLDEFQITIDHIRDLQERCPFKGAAPALLCDANAHLGPEAGQFSMA